MNILVKNKFLQNVANIELRPIYPYRKTRRHETYLPSVKCLKFVTSALGRKSILTTSEDFLRGLQEFVVLRGSITLVTVT